MVYSILLIVAGLIGLDHLLRPINNFSRTIIALQIVYILITLFTIQYVIKFGLPVAILAATLIIIYGFTKKELDSKQRGLLILSAFPILIARVLTYMDWPYIHVFSLTMIIPILLFFFLMIPHFKKYQSEIGFLAIMTISAIIRLSKAIDWMY